MITFYHNPRCSKSRQALNLLETEGCEVTIIQYIKHPLSKDELKTLAIQLKVSSARDMMRTNESEYKALQLGQDSVTEEQLFDAMVNSPKLIERPIAVNGSRARIGRPPELVLELLS